jgi:hypothetical protein
MRSEQYRERLVGVRERVQKLEASGRTVDETVAEPPTADYDDTWGKGLLQPDQFVRIVSSTL